MTDGGGWGFVQQHFSHEPQRSEIQGPGKNRRKSPLAGPGTACFDMIVWIYPETKSIDGWGSRIDIACIMGGGGRVSSQRQRSIPAEF